MDDFLTVDVVDGQTNLGEPVQDLRFAEHRASLAILSDFLAEVAPVGVVHDDVQVAVTGLKGVLEADDERVL